MPIYHLKCIECGYEYSHKQSIKDPLPKDCPTCFFPGLEAVIHACPVINKTPKTVGTLAERNRAKMGVYERDQKDKEQKEYREKKGPSVLKHKPRVKPYRRQKEGRPWYRPHSDEVDPQLMRLDKKQVKQFVEKGKV